MTAQAAYDPSNIFARIIRGELPCVKVFEDADALAFMDIFPQTEGHTLVIPKAARATGIFDIEPQALSRLIVATQKVAAAVRAALRPDGVRIIQFNGAAAGQTVYHIHFHVLPVYAGRSEAVHASGAKADAAALEAVAARIRSAIGANA